MFKHRTNFLIAAIMGLVWFVCGGIEPASIAVPVSLLTSYAFDAVMYAVKNAATKEER